jgi:hypothetical protein
MRLRSRNLPREAIYESLESFEIIEEYPEDKYLPSYLVYCEHQFEVLHVLIAVDLEGVNVRIVTVYRPDPSQWTEDLKSRKEEA